ncbi:MAG: hypothetical protein ACRCXT_13675 [Paraclostridium sp.]
MDRRIMYSILITLGVVFGTLYILSPIFQIILGEVGIYISMFATTIFTIVYCTQLVINKDIK